MKTLVLLLLATTAAADDSPPLVPAQLPAKISDAVREEAPRIVYVVPHEEAKPPPAIPVRVSTTSIRIAMNF